MNPAEPVTVPPELARGLVRLAVIGAAALSQRDGGLQLAPGLAELLARLDMSGGGRPFANMSDASPGAGSGYQWLTVREASTVVNLSPRQIRRLAGGKLRARMTDGGWQIDASAAADYGKANVG